MNYRAIFTDIDGTLLNSSLEVSGDTAKMLREETERGTLLVLVSARSPSGIRPISERYRFRCAVIAYSGGLALDENGKVLFQQAMSGRCANRVLDCLDALNCTEPGMLTVNLFSGDDWRVRDRSDERVRSEEETVWTKARECADLHARDEERIHKILCMCRPDRMDLAERTLRRNFPELSIARSWSSLIEIMDGGVNKAGALERLCRLRGIDMAQTVAFGDQMNELEMLRAAGCGVAMGNALEEVKKAADLVTLDHDRDGIARALRKLRLQEI